MFRPARLAKAAKRVRHSPKVSEYMQWATYTAAPIYWRGCWPQSMPIANNVRSPVQLPSLSVTISTEDPTREMCSICYCNGSRLTKQSFCAGIMKHSCRVSSPIQEAWTNGGSTAVSKPCCLMVLNRASIPIETSRPGWRPSSRTFFRREHLDFLQSLELTFSCGDFLFVHAGVRPGVPIHEQTEDDLLWIRDDFLTWEQPFERFVVHGHTPVSEPDLRPNRINIDTGAYATGRLTCVVIENTAVTQLTDEVQLDGAFSAPSTRAAPDPARA